jgi:hypothetical protein
MARGELMLRALGIVGSMLLAGACPAFAEDAAAPRAVSSYSRYELRDLRADVKVQPKVIAKLTTELKLKLDEPMARWNEAGAQPGHAGTVAIDVGITQMKFVSGGKRFMVGAMAGSSSCAAIVQLIDADSGAVLAQQTFSELSGAMAGGYTMGAADNHMLDRLAANIGNWVIHQYSRPAASAEAGIEVETATDEPTSDPVVPPAPESR